MKKIFFLTISLTGILLLGSCKKDDATPTTRNLTLNISGLEDLGSSYAYEGWLIVNGSPVSSGIFNVDASGNLSQTSFAVSTSNLDNASAFVLTIEPSPDSNPAPSDVHILAGDFSGNSASLSIGHASAVGTDFSNATATYVLRAPTDDGDGATNFQAGVWWFMNIFGTTQDCCTNLPELPTGWNYEGWAVVDGTPLSTGVFADGEVNNVSRRDSYSDRDVNNNADPALATGFNGNVASGPNYPGEDFIQNLPAGVTTPVDLRGKRIVITVEPNPDNSPNPFTLKPLIHDVPATAGLENLVMNNNAAASNPTGTASRQ
ncbi:MAG: hypothetical protein GKR88_16210 [Flavobacteriaceae bacterium]|nr:MAG: hypothetical protein GKR88_16210 [Flavobacteriaceae bacterium]